MIMTQLPTEDQVTSSQLQDLIEAEVTRIKTNLPAVEVQYFTDPQLKAGMSTYRFMADLHRNDDPEAYILADLVVINPALAALNRVIKAALGKGWYVGRYWNPCPDDEAPF